MTTLRSHIHTESIWGFALIDSCELVHVPLQFCYKLRISFDMLLHPPSLPLSTRHQAPGGGGRGRGFAFSSASRLRENRLGSSRSSRKTDMHSVRNAYTRNRLGRRSINTKPDATKEGRKRSVCMLLQALLIESRFG